MAVGAIQTNTNNQRSTSYANASALGALAGFSLKWVLPLSQQEKDERFSSKLTIINNQARKARKEKFEEIKLKKDSNKTTDTFVKLHKSNKLNQKEIKKLKEPARTEVSSLLNGVNELTRNIRKIGRKALEAYTKSIRPAGPFIVTGAAIGLAVAYVRNVISKIKQDSIN